MNNDKRSPMIILKAWNTRHVIKLASAAGDMVTARALQLSQHWNYISHDGYCIWAEYHESDKKHYQIKIDMIQVQAEQQGFSCTCNRHRPPCEHVLSVLLTVLENPDQYFVAQAPEEILSTFDRRSRRVRSRLEKRQKVADIADAALETEDESPVANGGEPNQQGRLDKMQAGIHELDTWLKNLVRQGLGHVSVRDATYWETIINRMIDAFMPGLAQKLREISKIPETNEDDWIEPLLAELGTLYLLVDSFKRYDDMPFATQLDIRESLGWPLKVIAPDAAAEMVRDTWILLGRRDIKHNRNSWLRRSWFYGRTSQRMAVTKEYVFDPALFEVNIPGGYEIDATLLFFPSRYPLRAQLQSASSTPVPATDIPSERLSDAMQRYRTARAKNPWFSEMVINAVDMMPLKLSNRWVMKISDTAALPLNSDFVNHWPLLSLSGGHPLHLIAEWDGQSIFPVAAVTERYIDLTDESLS